MNRRTLSLVALLLLAIPTAALAGGPAVVSLTPLHTAVVAGQPVAVDFSIAGCHTTSNLSPVLNGVSGRQKVRVEAKPFGAPSHYRAMVTFPSAGKWTLAVDTGLLTRKHALQVAVHPAGPEARAAR